MKKIVLSFSIILLSIILTGCVDKEIKELNGEWEGYVEGDRVVMKIKNGDVKIINYGEHYSKEDAEKFPLEAEIYKEGDTLKLIDEEGDGTNFHLVNDKLVFEGGVFYRIK